MTPDELAGLLEAAVGDEAAWVDVPVGVRACLAAVALAAAGQPVTGKSLADTAGFSRSTAFRPNSPWLGLLTALRNRPTALYERLSQDIESSSAPASALAGQLAQRDRMIAELRRELRAARQALQPLTDYAHDLAVELRRFRDDERDRLERRVVHLRPVEQPPE